MIKMDTIFKVGSYLFHHTLYYIIGHTIEGILALLDCEGGKIKSYLLPKEVVHYNIIINFYIIGLTRYTKVLKY